MVALPTPAIHQGHDCTCFVDAASGAPILGANNLDAISMPSVVSDNDDHGPTGFGLYGGVIDHHLAADVWHQFNVDDGHGWEEFLNAFRLVTEKYVAHLRPIHSSSGPGEFIPHLNFSSNIHYW